MTEPESRVSPAEEKTGRQGDTLGELARDAAELLRQAIKNSDPADFDFKEIKQLTGALKDLAELMEGRGEDSGEGGIVIRIENDPSI